MRNKRRLGVVLALAATVALGSVGVAQAINANSTVTLNFTKTPPGAVGGTLKQGKINVHTHTNYTASGTTTTQARLYFDKNFSFSPNVVPKCPTAAVSGNITMKQAMTACSTRLVGTGTAQANLATPGDIKGCVLAFNAVDGNASVGGNQPGILLFTRLQIPGNINCSNPANNQNGNGSILLQAPLATNPASTTPGGPLPASHYQGGKWLNFANIPQTAPLSDFNVTVGKGAPGTNLAGTKGNYVRAKCTSRAGLGTPAKKWVLRTIFKYNSGTPNQQVVNSKRACT
jgi:hypothetical protein